MHNGRCISAGLVGGGACLQGDSVQHWTRGELLIVLRRSSGDKREGVVDATTDEVLFRSSLFLTGGRPS